MNGPSPDQRTVLGLSLSPRSNASWPSRTEVAQAVALAVGLTLLARMIVPVVGGLSGDARHYIAMASDPDAIVATPFAYRVLTPWLVQILGTSPLETFHILAVAFLGLTGVFVYLITRGLGGGHYPGLIAVFGLLTVRGWLFNFQVPYLADQAAMSLAGAAFAALVWRVDLLLPAILVIWALSREVWAGFALPAYAWIQRRFIDPAALLRVFLMAFPALIVMLVLYRFAPVQGAEAFGRVADWLVQNIMDSRLPRLRFWIAYTFTASLGIWWVLALSRPRVGGALWLWLIPVFLQFLLGADWSRFALYAFVVVIPVGAIAVWEHPRRRLLLAIVLLQLSPTAADLIVHGSLRLNRTQPSFWITVALMAATLAVVVLSRLDTILRARRAIGESASQS